MTQGLDSPFWWSDVVHGGVGVAFTSVRAGNLAHHVGSDDSSHVRRRRQSLESFMGVPVGSLGFLDQVHSARVLDAEEAPTSSSRPRTPTGDAWVSATGAQPLAVMVADCLPVLLTGACGRAEGIVTAAAHVGRGGLLGGVLENTVEMMTARGAEAITAWIGPGACGACYEVPAAMRDQLSAGRPSLASQTRWGTPALDLRAEAAAVLERLTVSVVDQFGCTIEDETLFSHRRAPGEGRFAGVIWRREPVGR